MKPSRPIALATLLFAAQSWISALPAAAGTGLAFLKTGIGARSVSLGSAVVSNVAGTVVSGGTVVVVVVVVVGGVLVPDDAMVSVSQPLVDAPEPLSVTLILPT